MTEPKFKVGDKVMFSMVGEIVALSDSTFENEQTYDVSWSKDTMFTHVESSLTLVPQEKEVKE